MLEGRSASDRNIASPRKMCVPGVQACATAGVSTSANSTARPTRLAENARDEARGIACALDPDALTLPTDCFAEVVQFVLHRIIDRVLRAVDVFTHLFDDLVKWNAIDQIFPALHRASESTLRPRCYPTRTFFGPASRPSRPVDAVVTNADSASSCTTSSSAFSSFILFSAAEAACCSR